MADPSVVDAPEFCGDCPSPRVCGEVSCQRIGYTPPTPEQSVVDALNTLREYIRLSADCHGHCRDGGCPFCGGALPMAMARLAVVETALADLRAELTDQRAVWGSARGEADAAEARAVAAEAERDTLRKALEHFRDSYELVRNGCDDAHLDLSYDRARAVLAGEEPT